MCGLRATEMLRAYRRCQGTQEVFGLLDCEQSMVDLGSVENHDSPTTALHVGAFLATSRHPHVTDLRTVDPCSVQNNLHHHHSVAKLVAVSGLAVCSVIHAKQIISARSCWIQADATALTRGVGPRRAPAQPFIQMLRRKALKPNSLSLDPVTFTSGLA